MWDIGDGLSRVGNLGTGNSGVVGVSSVSGNIWVNECTGRALVGLLGVSGIPITTGFAMRYRIVGVTMVAAMAVACGGGETPMDPGDVIQQVVFPPLDPAIVQGACIQGAIAPTQEVSGTVQQLPPFCQLLEAWRVRVARRTVVAFTVSSSFDSGLGLFHITDIDSYDPGSPVAQDDNSGQGLDARIEHTLLPDEEYAIVVVSANQSGSGSYRLDVRALD